MDTAAEKRPEPRRTVFYIVNNHEDLLLGLPHYTAILHFLDALAQGGRRVVLVMPRQDVSLEQLRTVYGIQGLFQIHWLPRLPSLFRRQMLANVAACWYVRRAIRPGDAAYTRYLPAAVLGLLGRPVVVELHQWFWERPVQQVGYRLLLQLCLRLDRARRIALVTITRAMQDCMPPWMFAERSSLVAWSGVAEGVTAGTSEPALEKRSGQDGPLLFYAGIFERQKGVEFMIALANAAPEFRFLFVGCPGERLEEVRRRLTAGNARVLGRVSPVEARALLEQADYGLALNDPHSGWLNRVTSPLKLFEYMAAGKVPLATDMPVMREVVRDGQNGVLVDPSDPAGIVARVRELEQDRALRARLVRGGLETARQNTWRERARRVLDFLDGHTAR